MDPAKITAAINDAGFLEAAVCVKPQTKRAGILKDIIQESYQTALLWWAAGKSSVLLRSISRAVPVKKSLNRLTIWRSGW